MCYDDFLLYDEWNLCEIFNYSNRKGYRKDGEVFGRNGDL
jgi:hypothetical protein